MTIREAQNILAQEIVYKNFDFRILNDMYTDDIIIKLKAPVRDACSGYYYDVSPIIPILSREMISAQYFEQMTKEQFINRIYYMCELLEIHELKEHFKVNNVCLHDPHPELKKQA